MKQRTRRIGYGIITAWMFLPVVPSIVAGLIAMGLMAMGTVPTGLVALPGFSVFVWWTRRTS